MKTTLIILLFISYFLPGCGEDSVVDNPPKTPTSDTVILFTKDSIYLNQSTWFRDSVEYSCTVPVDTLYVEFRIFTSAHYLDGNFSFFINSSMLFGQHVLSSEYTTWDSTYSLRFPVSIYFTPPFNIKFKIERGGWEPGFLFSLKNIKLWYIKRT